MRIYLLRLFLELPPKCTLVRGRAAFHSGPDFSPERCVEDQPQQRDKPKAMGLIQLPPYWCHLRLAPFPPCPNSFPNSRSLAKFASKKCLTIARRWKSTTCVETCGKTWEKPVHFPAARPPFPRRTRFPTHLFPPAPASWALPGTPASGPAPSSCRFLCLLRFIFPFCILDSKFWIQIPVPCPLSAFSLASLYFYYAPSPPSYP